MGNFDDKLKSIDGGVLQQFYDEKTLTIAAGQRFEIFAVFNYFRVLALTGSGLAIIFGDNQYETPFSGAGIGYKLESTIKRFTLINTSGAPITLTYAIAIGQVNDDRLNVSGTVNIAGSVSLVGTSPVDIKNPNGTSPYLEQSSATITTANFVLNNVTPTLIIPAGATNLRALVLNTGAGVMTIGTAAMTVATGYGINIGRDQELKTKAAVYAMSVAAAGNCAVYTESA